MVDYTKPWNQQLKDWIKDSGKSQTQLSFELGIPRSTLRGYINGICTLKLIKPENLMKLYEVTGLECFKYSTPTISMEAPKDISADDSKKDTESDFGKELSTQIRKGKEGIEKAINDILSNIPGGKKLELGLLKAQLYNPSVAQRVDAIMQLLEVLSEEIDYFRSASSEEKKILVERLQSDPQNYSYVHQMLNVIYQGKQLDAWMLLAQPPSKIKKILKGK